MTEARRTPRTRSNVRAAFTLVEMTIAIGIIVLLTALTVTASIALVNRAEIKKTENVLLLLDSALAEWESRADRSVKITYPATAGAADMTFERPSLLTASELMQRMRRHDDIRAIFGRIETDQLVTYDNTATAPAWLLGDEPVDTPDALSAFNSDLLNPADEEPWLAVLDSWGNPIIAVHPGWLWRDGVDPGIAPADEDGTVRNPQDVAGTGTGIEERYGVAKSRRVYFMSAGPDELYGDLSAAPQDPMRKAVDDNIYSYEVEEE